MAEERAITPLRFKGAAVGRCNICGDFGKLTEDHTPPKGCYRPTSFDIQHLHQALGQEPRTRRYRSNNGVRFRSLCARCNNELLGGSYDKALIEFTRRVSQFTRFRGVLPRVTTVSAQPQKVMRSVFGHLAAAAVDGYGQWEGYVEFREWFLTGEGQVPSGFRFHYWLYPYKPQVIVRGFGFIPEFGIQRPFIGWLIKFFPLAFLIVRQEEEHTLQLADLTAFDRLPLGEEAELPLYLDHIVDPNWPEANPGDTGVILTGDHALRADEVSIRGRR